MTRQRRGQSTRISAPTAEQQRKSLEMSMKEVVDKSSAKLKEDDDEDSCFDEIYVTITTISAKKEAESGPDGEGGAAHIHQAEQQRACY